MPDDGNAFFGFPERTLGAQPCRLPIIGQLPGLFCVNKPAGIVADAHPWYAGKKNIIEALRKQLEAGKPELVELGMQVARSIFILDAEFSGVFLIAGTTEAVEHYRNAYGSGAWEFVFHLIVEKTEPDFAGEQTCALPVKNDREGTGLRISHRYGKQANTAFKRLQTLRNWELWEARTSYYRLHQIRAHAHAIGLRIVGETHYGEVAGISSAALKDRGLWKGDAGGAEFFASGGHLLELKLPEATFSAPYPDKWTVFLERLGTPKNT